MVRHIVLISLGLLVGHAASEAQDVRGPRSQPETAMGMYAPNQHELYDGRFIIRATRIFQAGKLNDPSPWNHMGDDASNLRPVQGDVVLDVNEIENTGTFHGENSLKRSSSTT